MEVLIFYHIKGQNKVSIREVTENISFDSKITIYKIFDGKVNGKTIKRP